MGAGCPLYMTGDTLQFRTLYDSEIQRYDPQFKIHVMCNDAPQVNGDDAGVARRVRKIDYKSLFVEPHRVDESQHRYLMDDSFIKEVLVDDVYKMEFMRYILDHYIPNLVLGDVCPASILDSSRLYLNDNSDILDFINDNIEAGSSTDYFTLKEAKEAYKRFDRSHRTKISGLSTKLQKALNCEFRSQYMPKGTRRNEKNVFIGYKLVDPSAQIAIVVEDDE